MNELKIERLIVMGMGAEQAAIISQVANGECVLARGKAAVDWLTAMDIANVVQLDLDDRLSQANAGWRDRLYNLISTMGEVNTLVYVTSISPLNLDMVAGALARISTTTEWWTSPLLPGLLPPSQEGALEGVLQTLDILSLQDKHYPIFSPGLPVLIHTAGVKVDVEKLHRLLTQVYPPVHTIHISGGLPGSTEPWRVISLGKLKACSSDFSALFIPPGSADASLESFMQVIAQLRAPDGCPWDRKQTHTSLRPYLLEETYEALERLDSEDLEGLKEELGDLLLQIALHSQIAAETGTFTISQVLQHINHKIVSRHPHVFGTVNVKDDRDVVQNWEKLKELERAGNGKAENNGLLDGIPQILPALSQAQSIQDRAARVGFDWPEIAPVLGKVFEELQEVNEARDEREHALELGDLLFAVVNLVRWYKVDAESALRGTNTKFRKRFAYIEAEAKKAGRELQKMTLEEMDALWEASKEFDAH